MMRRFVLLWGLVGSLGWGVDSIYLGGQVGQIGLTGSSSTLHQNAIGFGLDIGLRTNPLIELLFQSQWSSHTGTSQNLKIFSQTVGMVAHFEMTEFDFTLGLGPGFYNFSRTTSQTFFGLHWDAGADLVLSPQVRTGLGFRYHSLFGESGADDFWSVMLRVGTTIELG